MLIYEKIRILITKRNRQHFISLGYDINDKFLDIDNRHLTKGSHSLVNVKCDKCGNILLMQYNVYMKSIKNDLYYCQKCKYTRIKNTNMLKYDDLFNMSDYDRTYSMNYDLDKQDPI